MKHNVSAEEHARRANERSSALLWLAQEAHREASEGDLDRAILLLSELQNDFGRFETDYYDSKKKKVKEQTRDDALRIEQLARQTEQLVRERAAMQRAANPEKSKRRKQLEAAAWRKKGKDFKGVIEGKKFMMVFEPGKGTVLAPLESFTDEYLEWWMSEDKPRSFAEEGRGSEPHPFEPGVYPYEMHRLYNPARWIVPEGIEVVWSPLNQSYFALWPAEGPVEDRQVLKVGSAEEMNWWLQDTYGTRYGLDRARRAAGRRNPEDGARERFLLDPTGGRR